MHVEPQREHQWLQRLAGEWTIEMEATGPDGATDQHGGRERVRGLGEVWVLCEGEAEMPGGGTGRTLMTLGYDPARGKFVGTFVGSMMTHLWRYEGELDASGTTLTLDTEGPSFAPDVPAGTMVRYQDVIELRSDDHRVLTSSVLGDDGAWQPFMTAHYRRAGAG